MHSFPEPVHDAVSAYLYLLDEGIAPENIVICGDSAGAAYASSGCLGTCSDATRRRALATSSAQLGSTSTGSSSN